MTLLLNSETLKLRSAAAFMVEALLIGLALVLPSVAHFFGWPVFIALPMHYGIMLAGLVYGWKGGLAAGISAPVISHFISGMPALPMLATMVPELMVYGTLPGLLKERFKMNGFAAMAIGIVSGRLVFIGLSLLLGRQFMHLSQGIYTGLFQIAVLPVIAAVLVNILKKAEN